MKTVKGYRKILSLIMAAVLVLSMGTVSVMANSAVLATDGSITTIEFETVGVSGMENLTGTDSATNGTYSGTGYLYQMNSTSGEATKTITIPVAVKKTGTYLIDVHACAYSTASSSSNDTGKLSVKVGDTMVPLSRDTTVLFGAQPYSGSEVYKVYSYKGEIELEAYTTSVDLIYTFTGTNKYKLVLDNVNFQYQDENKFTVEFETLGVSGMSKKTAIDSEISGTYSGTGYLYQVNSTSGAATKTITIPVKIKKAGTYSIDVQGCAYATKSDPKNDLGTLSVKVGDTTVQLSRDKTVLFGAKADATASAYKVYSYKGEIELASDTTSIDLIYTFTGTDKFKLVLDCANFEYTDESKMTIEFETLGVSGMSKKTAISNDVSGTYSGEGYLYQMNSTSGAATKTITIPVKIKKAGVYSIDVQGCAYATKSDPKNDLGTLSVKVGDTTIQLSRDKTVLFGAKQDGVTYNVYSYKTEIGLAADTTSIDLIYTFTGTDKFKLVLDCATVEFKKDVLSASGTKVSYEVDTYTPTLTSINGGFKRYTGVKNGIASEEQYGFIYATSGGEHSATFNIPVKVAEAGVYSVKFVGCQRGDNPSVTLTAGSREVTFENDNKQVFQTDNANGRNSNYSATTFTADIYLDETITSIGITGTASNGGYTFIVDSVSFMCVEQGEFLIVNAKLTDSIITLDAVKQSALENESLIHIAVYDSADLLRLDNVYTVPLVLTAGIQNISQPITVEDGNVVKVFAWETESLEPLCDNKVIK